MTDETLFLGAWVVLPLLYFSLSVSKLPLYILPVYPPLSVLASGVVVNNFNDSSKKKNGFPVVTSPHLGPGTFRVHTGRFLAWQNLAEKSLTGR